MQDPAHESTEQVSGIDVQALTRALAEPFEREEVKFKPAVVSGNRAMALAYVDARVIQDRLDEVLGPLNWQDDYECLSDGSVVCRLRLRLGNEWVTKVDVGGPSEQPDGGDRLKAAFSDALKRAAVKFGIGRYLYRLPSQWVDYDPHKRQFAKPPTLPDFALPTKGRKPAEQPTVKPAAAQKKTQVAGKPGSSSLPANGAELQKRLQDYDAKLAGQGLCERGALVKQVAAAGTKAGYPADLTTWSGPAIKLAVEETRAFEASLRQPQAKKKEVA
ncbi:MAG TPA: Rad52/Rad22 family DNA repair protein [Gemmataceae bacterium]|nr:Rad52/Rad22 family DNA repair protein [Gemmataceae bacterium]